MIEADPFGRFTMEVQINRTVTHPAGLNSIFVRKPYLTLEL